MNPLKHYDYLIVGQGLAGSLLAWRLITAGQRVLVIDNGQPAAASRVAAGLINPVTGKRLVKEANAERFLAMARDWYTELGKQFNHVFLHDKPMLRLFDPDEIKPIWEKRRADPAYQRFIGASLNPHECGYPQGGFIQNQTGYLASTLLLNAIELWLQERQSLIATQFDYSDITISSPLGWRGIHIDKIIFCEGAAIAHNPWFNTLPMQPAQGEILTLQTHQPLPHWIVNAGRWLLPLGEGRFKLGATYTWPTEHAPLTDTTSETAKSELLTDLAKLFPSLTDYKIIAHEAGIRPGSKDRRPLIGFHHRYPDLAVFNGFGSKGSMLIPYYAQHFVDVLLKKTALDSDVNITRVIS